MASVQIIEGLEAWDVDVKEVSSGWFVLNAVRKTGNRFEKSGVDPKRMIDELREFERTIQQKKLEARS